MTINVFVIELGLVRMMAYSALGLAAEGAKNGSLSRKNVYLGNVYS